MSVAALSSLLGVYEHVSSNLEVVWEVKSNLTTAASLLEAVRGAAPLLAPGILALIALMAMAATYYHPALGNRSDI